MTSKLYRAFLSDRFFTTAEALVLIPNKATCMNTLKQLVSSRQVVRVRKGLYEVVPQEHIDDQKPAADKFLLARKITHPYCLAYHSALELHGAANTATYNTVDLASPRQFRSFSYERVHYKWIPRRELTGTERTIWSNSQLTVTDREKTILDCIDRIDLAGGVEEVFKSLVSMKNINFRRLYDYATRERKKVLFHKLGFFLSRNEMRESWHLDDRKLDSIRANLSSKVYYFLTEKGSGKLERQWNLIVPVDLEETLRFA
jgi:predicted transcriptional regulator of viral defense system